MLFAEVDAQCPGTGEHQVENTETEGKKDEDCHLSGDEGGEEHADGGDGKGAVRLLRAGDPQDGARGGGATVKRENAPFGSK